MDVKYIHVLLEKDKFQYEKECISMYFWYWIEGRRDVIDKRIYIFFLMIYLIKKSSLLNVRKIVY